MKKITLPASLILAMFSTLTVQAQVPVKPAHVIFVLEENYSRTEVIGSSYAPTLTALSKDSTTVNFTQAYAITHPSEPNYLDLFSGSEQGVIADETGPDANAPFDDCNMASALIQLKKGYTFAGYSETQPSVGWVAGDVGNYATKHSPWINWQSGDNGILGNADTVPSADDLPMFPLGTYFPDSNHYSTLPTVSWIIPNLIDDMHNPSTASTAISNGDTWFKTNVMPLVRWASNYNNNTLVIVIWDEDDGLNGNNIPLLFCGGIVAGGTCTTKVNHYDILKTVEDMYGATLCGAAATGIDVPETVWTITGINSINKPTCDITTWPVPAQTQLNIHITASVDEPKANIGLYDVTGRLVKEMTADLKMGDNYISMNTAGISNGVYFINIAGEKINASKKISIQQ